MAYVRIFRLLSGEFVVSECGTVTNDSYIVINPAQVTMQDDGSGKMRVGLVDFLPFAEKDDKTVTISSSLVIYSHKPNVDMLNAYATMFGSGIILAGSSSLPSSPRPNLRSV
mgnify:CR=1 FL=1